jgi:hypothetical protein
MGKEYVLTFFGYSGDPVDTIDFDTGRDTNKQFELVANTIGRMSKNRNPSLNVLPAIQSWNYWRILRGATDDLRGLGGPDARIKELHICCHGGTSMLSLAMDFQKGDRIRKRAMAFNARARAVGNDQALLEAFDAEDAWITGTLSVLPMKNGGPDYEHKRWKANEQLISMFAPGAYIHIWGCNPGAVHAKFGQLPESRHYDREVDAYLKRFGWHQTHPGIARDIAIQLGVPVTAARLLPGKHSGGLEFWVSQGGAIVKTETRRRYGEPMWLWAIRNSEWMTYNHRGDPEPAVRIFDMHKAPHEVAGGKPPTWFTSLYR